MTRTSRWLRRFGITAVVFGALTALIGFAHTPMGRPLLGLMRPLLSASGQSCPLGYDAAATPAQREEARRRFSQSHAHPGGLVAKGRPALGFQLDATTRAEVNAWAAARGLRCVSSKSADLSCDHVAASELPEGYRGADVEALWFNFGLDGTLISLTAVRRDASAQRVEETYEGLQAALTREAGPVFHTEGDASAAVLASAPLRQASSELRFRDYYALVRATNMGDGFVLTEEYRSLAVATQ